MATRMGALSVAAALLASPALAAGQAAAPEAPPVAGWTPVIAARDSGARMERLADGVYAIIHADATDDWPHGNTGVVVGDRGVLVVDATYFPSRAAADIALIRRVTRLPVRWLVNTHWHGDHTHGNGVYRDSFPDLQILGASDNARYIAFNQRRYPRFAAVSPVKRRQLTVLQDALASGHDSAGGTLTAEARRATQAGVRQHEEEYRQLALVREAPPTVLFDGDTTLAVGRHRVQLRNRGRANSPADVTVYLPSERVLFTGDVEVYPVPYAMQSYPGPWVRVLRDMERLPVRAVVPGHGPVLPDHAYGRRERLLFETVLRRVDSMGRAGLTVDSVKRAIDIGDLRAAWLTGPAADPGSAALWDYSIRNALVERSWGCVIGYLC